MLIGYAAANLRREPPPPPPTTTTAPTTTTHAPTTTTTTAADDHDDASTTTTREAEPPPKKHPQKKPKQPKKKTPKLGQPLTGTPPLGGRYVFPVAGGADWGDTYGAERSDVPGGWHHGDDLFAPLGTPVVAVADGTIFAVGWNRVGGWRLWLVDHAGNDFYYAHLSGYTTLARTTALFTAATCSASSGIPATRSRRRRTSISKCTRPACCTSATTAPSTRRRTSARGRSPST